MGKSKSRTVILPPSNIKDKICGDICYRKDTNELIVESISSFRVKNPGVEIIAVPLFKTVGFSLKELQDRVRGYVQNAIRMYQDASTLDCIVTKTVRIKPRLTVDPITKQQHWYTVIGIHVVELENKSTLLD